MADEKTKVVTDETEPDAGPAPAQPEAGGGAPALKQEQPAPEAVSPDKATAPEQAAPAQTEKGAAAPKEQKAAKVNLTGTECQCRFTDEAGAFFRHLALRETRECLV